MKSFFALSTVLAALFVFVAANPEPCSDHPGVIHHHGKKHHHKSSHKKSSSKKKTTTSQTKTHWQPVGSLTTHKKAIPKVKGGNSTTIEAGVGKVVGQLAGKGYLPPAVASPLASAISKVINQTAADDALTTAGLNIKAAIQDALNAVNMSQSALNGETIGSLESCLATVMASGGLPSGYSCLTSSGSSNLGLQATLNTTLDQFVGILPNKILTNLFNAITPLLTDLLPASEMALVTQIEKSIASLTATTSAASSTALEQMQNCYTQAIQQAGNVSSLACYQQGAGSTLATAANSMLETFVGVLPAALTTQVQNILAFNTAKSDSASDKLAASVQAQISNAINSAASTLSGNTVSLAETLQACISQLMQTGDAEAANKCLTSDKATTLSTTMIDGIAEQFSGYLPSSFFSDLVEAATPLINNKTVNVKNANASTIFGAFDSFFNNATSYGPAYVGCLEQVEACVKNAITKSGTLAAVCPGPVSGCTLSKPGKLRSRRAVSGAQEVPSVMMEKRTPFVSYLETRQAESSGQLMAKKGRKIRALPPHRQ